LLVEQLALVPESRLNPDEVDTDAHDDGLPNIDLEPAPPFGPPRAPLAVAPNVWS
jgi:hypothetical protein